MTKTANSSTKSPDALGLPGYYFADDYVEVVELINYGNVQARQFQDCSGIARPLRADGTANLLDYVVWIPPWATNVSVRIITSGTGTAAPSVVVGGASAWTPGTGDQSTTLATSSTGTGWQAVTVSLGVTAGSYDLDLMQIVSDSPAVTALADPVVE